MKKDYNISYIRALSTIMVVTLHIANHIAKTKPCIVSDWLNLGLVMFFVMSGFLYSKRNIAKEDCKKWILHRYAEIVIPAIIAVMFADAYFAGLALHGGGYIISKRRIISSIICGLGFEAFAPSPWVFVEYWFLTNIVICYATLPLIQKINFKKPNDVQFWGGSIIISLIFQGVLSAINSPVSWGSMLRFYLAYAVFRRYDIRDNKCKREMIGLSTIVIPLVAAICYIRYDFMFDGVLAALAELAFIYIQTIAGLVLFYWLYLAVQHIKKSERLIQITDTYSYPVYLTHSFFVGYKTSVIDRFENAISGIVVALLFTTLASALVLVISKPINRKINLVIERIK